MGRRALYYFWNRGNVASAAFAVVQYSNGERRYWNEGDKGYRAARAKACRGKQARNRAGSGSVKCF